MGHMAHDKQTETRRTREAGDVNMETKLLGGDRSQGIAPGRADGGRERASLGEGRPPLPPLPDQTGVGTEPREAGRAAEGRGEGLGCKQAWHPAVTPSISPHAHRRGRG